MDYSEILSDIVFLLQLQVILSSGFLAFMVLSKWFKK